VIDAPVNPERLFIARQRNPTPSAAMTTLRPIPIPKI
jgi:hypothetical protein